MVMEESFNRVHVSPSYNANNNPWVVSVFNGMLGVIDEDAQIEKITNYIGIQENGNGKYTDVIECNGKLYLLPDLVEGAPKILVIDGEKEKFITLRQFEILDEKKELSCFLSWKCIGKYIFAFGSSYPAILRIDSESDGVDYALEWVDKVNGLGACSSIGFLDSVQQVLIGSELFIPASCARAIVKINIDTLQEEVIDVDVISEGFSCISEMDEDRFLLAGAGDNSNWLYIWNRKQKVVEASIRLQNAPGELSVKYMLQSDNGDVYLFPWQNWSYQDDLDIYRFDYRTRELCNTRLIENHRNRDNKEYLFGHEVVYACWKDEKILMYVTGKDLLWHEYNVDTKDYCEYEINVDYSADNVDDLVASYYQEYSKKKKPIIESKVSLQRFMKIFDLLSGEEL